MTLAEKQLAMSRLALRDDQPLELHFDKIPEPSEQMMKLPGVAQWWAAMRLWDERRTQAFHRMVIRLQQTPP